MDPMTDKNLIYTFFVDSKAQMHHQLSFAYFQSSQNYILHPPEQETEFKVKNAGHLPLQGRKSDSALHSLFAYSLQDMLTIFLKKIEKIILSHFVA